MAAFKVGDHVSVLDETIRGKLVAIGRVKSKIEDEDGFIREYANDRIVPLKSSSTYKLSDDTLEPEVKNKLHSLLPKKSSRKVTAEPSEVFEIDLHYEALTDTPQMYSNYEILQKQLTACRSFVQKALSRKIKRIVIIHGKGEGVLKAEIHLYLNRLASERGVKLDFHEAPYHEYGMGGATEVVFY